MTYVCDLPAWNNHADNLKGIIIGHLQEYERITGSSIPAEETDGMDPIDRLMLKLCNNLWDNYFEENVPC